MNKTRRKQIATIANEILVAERGLRELADEEQEAMDAMPENLHGSDRYSAAEEAIEILTSAADSLEEVAGQLDEIT